MTFLMNIIHDDFSLIVADRKANTTGPTTVQLGNITVNMEQGGSIIGFKKININERTNLALGIAGDANQHKYLDGFNKSDTANDAMKLIEYSIDDNLALNDRAQFLEDYPFKENQGILSFFDEQTSKFYSYVYSFNTRHKCMQLFHSFDNTLVISTRGSGHQHFMKIIDQKSLDQLISEVHGKKDVQNIIAWITPLYEQISKLDDCVSKSFDTWLATKDTPFFNKYS